MLASVAALPGAKPRNRSIEARRVARMRKCERERLIVNSLNRGVSVAEIAQRIGVTEKRMRALVNEILARRMPAAPEDFAALQVSRLNEALLIAYSAMSPENLRAVGLVVRIVRELDRYHGFVAADRRSRREPGAADAEAQERLALWDVLPKKASKETTASERGQRAVHAPSEDAGAPVAPPADRPEMAPQALEKMEFAPGNGAASEALGGADEAAPQAPETPRPARPEDAGAGFSDEALAPPVAAPPPDPAPHAPSCDGPQMAPQAPEKIESAPENGRAPAAAEPKHGASSREDAFASPLLALEQAPPPPTPIELPRQTIGGPEPVGGTAMGVSMALDDLGRVRRVNFRVLPNGVAAC